MVLLMVVAFLVQAPETMDLTTVGTDPRWGGGAYYGGG
jgi:hypothetical protein